jgi:hypothetical protein
METTHSERSFTFKSLAFDLQVRLYPILGFLVGSRIERTNWILAGVVSNDVVSRIKSQEKGWSAVEDFGGRIDFCLKSEKTSTICIEDILRYNLLIEELGMASEEKVSLRNIIHYNINLYVNKYFPSDSGELQNEIDQEIEAFYSGRHSLLQKSAQVAAKRARGQFKCYTMFV